jgi:hypothetical protein
VKQPGCNQIGVRRNLASETLMSAVTDFIAELVRAANEVEKLQETEARRLLSRALRTIRDVRIDAGIAPSLDSPDEATDVLEACLQLHYEVVDAEGVRRALLKGASMIRDLRILQHQNKTSLH